MEKDSLPTIGVFAAVTVVLLTLATHARIADALAHIAITGLILGGVGCALALLVRSPGDE